MKKSQQTKHMFVLECCCHKFCCAKRLLYLVLIFNKNLFEVKFNFTKLLSAYAAFLTNKSWSDRFCYKICFGLLLAYYPSFVLRTPILIIITYFHLWGIVFSLIFLIFFLSRIWWNHILWLQSDRRWRNSETKYPNWR